LLFADTGQSVVRGAGVGPGRGDRGAGRIDQADGELVIGLHPAAHGLFTVMVGIGALAHRAPSLPPEEGPCESRIICRAVGSTRVPGHLTRQSRPETARGFKRPRIRDPGLSGERISADLIAGKTSVRATNIGEDSITDQELTLSGNGLIHCHLSSVDSYEQSSLDFALQ
jgi:hypothetical protein